MFIKLQEFILSHADIVTELFYHYKSLNKSLMLKSDLWDEFFRFSQEKKLTKLLDSPLSAALRNTQEAAMDEACLCLAIRPKVAQWNYVRYCFTTGELTEISIAYFLAFKEKLVQGNNQQPVLEFDLQPFERDFPKMHQSRSIGHGVEFLNRIFSNKLSRNLSSGDALIWSFLRVHGYGDKPFMINDRLKKHQRTKPGSK